MADGIARILSKQGFDPDNFVKKVSDGGEVGLRDVQTQVQTLAEETSLALKRNVYKNYSQFIETAKEISILEGEMYQLSHMLTDQKNILHSMMEMSVTEERVEGPGPVESDQAQPQEEEKLQNLAFLLEKVEGCSSVTEVPGRHLIHNGDLVELDPESFTPLQKVHIFLMNDSLMIATWLQNRRGPVKYAFQSLYELDNLAVVNARDVGQCKNAFKILMFPDTRMYQAEAPKAKRQWLDILEDTKKKKLAVDSHRRESAAVASLGLKAHRESVISWDDNNPFSEFDDDEESTPASTPQDPSIEQDLLHVDWLQELPEDLDVCVAQRDFEGAVNLIEKVNEHLNNSPKSAATKEYRARIDQRIKQLTEVLVGELQVAPERSIRGGPRAARRAVTQLIRLGKSSQACRLFLQNRSAITKYNIRQLKIEGATTLYMKKLSEVFFTNLHQTGREFIKAFPEHFTCYSFFVVWAKNELRGFMSIFRKQVFETKVNFTTVAECVHQAVESCHKLTEMGLDLSSTLTNIILKDLEKMIEETKEVQLDAIRRRGQEDLWRPVNHKSEEGIERFEADMEALGFEFINTYTFDDCFTALTSNTIHFTRSYLGFCTDLLHVYCQELHYLVCSGLAAVMEAQLRHVQRASLKKDFRDQKMFIERNGAFLVTTLLPLVEHRVMYRTGQSCQPLEDLRTKYRSLKRITTQISSVENGEEYV